MSDIVLLGMKFAEAYHPETICAVDGSIPTF